MSNDSVEDSVTKMNNALVASYQEKVILTGGALKEEHKRFADLVHVEGWKQVDAYQKVYPNSSKTTAHQQGSQTMRRGDIQAYVAAMRDLSTANIMGGVGWKKGMLMKVAMRSMQEEKVLDREGEFHGEFSFRGDWVAKAVAELNKMDGDTAPNRHEVSGPDGGPMQMQITDFEVIEYDDDEDGDGSGS